MKLADIVIRLDKIGHDVQRANVTPAEVLLLVAEHHVNAGGDPIQTLVEKGDAVEIDEVKDGKVTKSHPRTDAEELVRLKGRFHAKKIGAAYHGAMPTFPKTFDEARKVGVTLALPTGGMLEHQLL